MKKVLFVCAENAGRSQIAKYYFNREAESRGLAWRAESAGTIPATEVHSTVREILEEDGCDLSSVKPRLFRADEADRYDILISFGCIVKEALPLNIQQRIRDWNIDDPRDENREAVARISSMIQVQIAKLLDELSEE